MTPEKFVGAIGFMCHEISLCRKSNCLQFMSLGDHNRYHVTIMMNVDHNKDFRIDETLSNNFVFCA